jgi:Family of unknown function (DUF6979)
MNGYKNAAVEAARWIASSMGRGPAEGWAAAVAREFPTSESSQKKSCPRDAFLGLCEEGLVKGVVSGDYTRSEKNKKYAVEAVRLLSCEPELAVDIPGLWHRVLNGEPKAYNQQMHVVIGLWNEGFITRFKNE